MSQFYALHCAKLVFDMGSLGIKRFELFGSILGDVCNVGLVVQNCQALDFRIVVGIFDYHRTCSTIVNLVVAARFLISVCSIML